MQVSCIFKRNYGSLTFKTIGDNTMILMGPMERIEKNDFTHINVSSTVAVSNGTVKYHQVKFWAYFFSPLMLFMVIWTLGKELLYKIVYKGKRRPEVPIFLWGPKWFKECFEIRKNAARWGALDRVYHFDDKYKPIAQKTNFSWFWLGGILLNAGGLKNRARLAYRELFLSLRELAATGYDPEQGLSILSVACGTTEKLLEAAEKCIKDGINVRIHLLDYDPVALRESVKVAERLNILEHIVTYNNKANDVAWLFPDKSFHLVEVVGFYDYLSVEKATELTKILRNKLHDGGTLFFANVMPNLEKIFLDVVVAWYMNYKTPDDLIKIAKDAGFRDIKTHTEPLRIHSICVAKF